MRRRQPADHWAFWAFDEKIPGRSTTDGKYADASWQQNIRELEEWNHGYSPQRQSKRGWIGGGSHISFVPAKSSRIVRVMASSCLSSLLPFGILVVDGNGRVIHMNEAAEALVSRQHTPLRLKDGHIQAANQPDTHRIQRLIATACSSENGATPEIGGSLLMLAHGKTAATGLAVSIAPLADSRLFEGGHQRRAAIMTNEVAPRNLEDFETGLRELFGLTRAEAKLAISLACGLSLKDSTKSTNLTVKTGRSYLERIFAKTGTRQQSELVAVLKTVQPLSGRTSCP